MRKRLLRWVFSILLAFVYIIASRADIPQFEYRTYQINDGLSENSVLSILQDQTGHIWMGTKDGLNRFDGSAFKVYRKDSYHSLANNHIKALYEDEDGMIWVGTAEGLSIFNPHKQEFIPLEVADQNSCPIIKEINAICPQGDKWIWIATYAQGVFKYNKESKELFQYTAGKSEEGHFTNELVWTIYCDRQNIIWLGTRDGISKYNEDENSFTNYNTFQGHSTESLSIFEDSNGTLWFGTWGSGLLEYSRNTNQFYWNLDPKSTNYITHIRSILEYSPHELLIGADDGLFHLSTVQVPYEAKRIDNHEAPFRLSDQNVYCMLRDKHDALWIGTYFGGVNYYNPKDKKFDRYLTSDQPDALQGKAIREFAEDRDGNIWIATEDAGINILNPHTGIFKHINNQNTTPKISYQNIHTLQVNDSVVWIGSFSRGLDRLDLRTNTVYNYMHNPQDSTSLINDCVFVVYTSQDGRIYIGTSMGLCYYNPLKDNFVHVKGVNHFVSDIIEDGYGNLWIGTNGTGLLRYNLLTKKIEKTYVIQKENSDLCSSRISKLHIDVQDRLWVGTLDFGVALYSYKDDSFTIYDESSGLKNNTIMGILDDSDGAIWLSTNKGIAKFNLDTNRFITFLESDGLQSNQFNFRSSFKSRSGKFYFGGINGFTSFYPHEITNNNTSEKTIITEVETINSKNDPTKEKIKAIDKDRKIVLQHNQSSIIIKFILINYLSSAKNSYYYRLEGVTEEWIPLGNRRDVVLANLAPGNYCFQVRASNGEGYIDKEGDYLLICIRPPWWRHPVSYAIYLLVLGVIICFLVQRSRNKRIEKAESQRKQFERIKESELYRSKIDFFTNIAHEIRTPVSLISAPLEVVMQSGDFEKKEMDNLQIIARNTDRLKKLVNELLDFKKIDKNNYTISRGNHDIKMLIDDIYYRFESTARHKNITFNTYLPQQALSIFTDAEVITKVVSNLLTNALKYAKETITLTVEKRENSIIISVVDDGVGVSDKYKEAIFTPLFRIENEEKGESLVSGTGIGLAFVKQLLELINGSIEVKDNHPTGALFQVTIPMSDEEEHVVETASSSPYQIDDLLQVNIKDHKHSILIVEDNDELRKLLVETFQKDFTTYATSGAIDAMTIIKQQSIDIIVSDLMMNNGDGKDLLSYVKAHIEYSHIPFIMLSAKIDIETKIDVLNMGASVFVEKPFSISLLQSQVVGTLHAQQVLQDKLSNTPFLTGKNISQNKKDEAFINKLNEEIDRCMNEQDFTIDRLTDVMGMSRSNLQRKIKAISGMAPLDYIRLIRLKKAVLLLQTGNYQISEVCYMVGFNTPSYFSKCFQKQFGMLPKEFINNSNHQ